MKSIRWTPPILLFGFGALCYPLIELAWRGYSHWTMALAGGIVMVILFSVSRLPLALPLLWLIGALSITAIEFAVGCLVNRWLGWDVWDYSTLPLNLLGQICLPFTGVWFLLSIPAIGLCRLTERFWPD